MRCYVQIVEINGRTWSLNVSLRKNSIGSKCEWNVSMIVSGTLSKYSIIYPIVTSSGRPILSPMLMNFPLAAIGNIFNANARLMQKPAPPVANTNEIFLCVDLDSVWKVSGKMMTFNMGRQIKAEKAGLNRKLRKIESLLNDPRNYC